MASSASQLLIHPEDNQSYRHHILWLDRHVNNPSNQRKLKQLSEIDSGIKAFVSREECINYIREKDDRNDKSYIIFIVSGSLSEEVIPKIQNYTCVLTIFIFCTHVEKYANLEFPKLRAVCIETDDLMNKIEMCIAKDKDTTSFNFLANQHSSLTGTMTLKDQYSFRNLKEDQARFLWFSHMHEFMVTLENNDDEKAKKELINHCREQYKGKPMMSSKIEEFDQKLLSDNDENAINWYTDNSFLYHCINTVLRKENISTVYTYRYIIKLLCRQLKEKHKQFIQDYRAKHKKDTLRVFRGVHLKLEEIHLLDRNTDNLISLNGFVSTTKSKKVAMDFLQKRKPHGRERALIKIDIDMTNEHTVAFADVSELSKYPDEKEVLLSIGAVFLVKSVSYDEEQFLYIIHLSLCQHNQLKEITYIKQTYANSVDTDDQSVLFGQLLFDMGECESAVKYYKDALDRLSDSNNQMRATYLNNIGVCFNGMGRKDEALKYYTAALKVYEQRKDKRDIGACHHNIASIYHAKGDNRKALQYALDALDVRQSNKIEKAATLDLLGCIYLALDDIEAANNNFDEALKLRLRYLGEVNPHHPDIGVSYHNLGKANLKIKNYIEAKANYLRAAKIYGQNYPETHPLVVEINKCLEEIQKQLK